MLTVNAENVMERTLQTHKFSQINWSESKKSLEHMEDTGSKCKWISMGMI